MDWPFGKIGAALGFLSVFLGAFGRHALQSRISPANLEIFSTGTQYQMVHALALILLQILLYRDSVRQLQIAGVLFTFGVVIFSGSLYALAITDIRILGAITPLGGLCFLSGWTYLAIGIKKSGTKNPVHRD